MKLIRKMNRVKLLKSIPLRGVFCVKRGKNKKITYTPFLDYIPLIAIALLRSRADEWAAMSKRHLLNHTYMTLQPPRPPRQPHAQADG